MTKAFESNISLEYFPFKTIIIEIAYLSVGNEIRMLLYNVILLNN